MATLAWHERLRYLVVLMVDHDLQQVTLTQEPLMTGKDIWAYQA